MFGRVGQDQIADRCVAALAAAGCNVAGIQRLDGPTGVAIVLVGSDGANSIVVAAGANGRYDAQEIHADLDGIADAHILLVQLETPVDAVICAAKSARQAGAIVILDPAPAQVLPDSLLSSVDILTPNQHELWALTGSVGTPCDDIDALADTARCLCSRGPTTVIVKLGTRGCLIVDLDRVLHIPAPAVAACDSTGAGDTFNGALAMALAEERAIDQACAFAVCASALSVTRRGSQISIPSRLEVEEFSAHCVVGGWPHG
jgi:ribokinase